MLAWTAGRPSSTPKHGDPPGSKPGAVVYRGVAALAANVLAPSGFHEVRLWTGSAPNYAVNGRQLPYNYGSNIAYGDPVYLTTSGVLALYVVAGTTIDGIAYGFEYFDPNNILSGGFHPAWLQPSGLATTALVVGKVQTDPNMIFACQASGTALTATSIGLNIDILTSTSGIPVTTSGISKCALDAANVHNTATLPFRIVGIFGVTPGFSPSLPCINPSYVGTYDNQWLAVTMNTSDITTRTGQA